MKLLTCTLMVAALLDLASAESMMQAFKTFRDKKANQHKLPSNVKGVVCERSGSQPKSLCCNNKHGVRCSSDFQREKSTCPGAGCQVQSGLWGRCPRNLPSGHSCSERRGKNYYNHQITHSCRTNGDIQQSLCPQPCGCVLDGQPKRESSGIMKTQKIQVFDLFIHPKRNEARYGLAIGAARCHRKTVEVGYMYTGMWKVDTVNNYKCHWQGGCSGVGIPTESIEKARVALEWYAWKNLRVGRRRLSSDEDSVDDNAVHTVDMEDMSADYGRTLRGDFDDDEDDLGSLAGALTSPTAFRIAKWGQRFGPYVGPMKSAIGFDEDDDEDDDDLGSDDWKNKLREKWGYLGWGYSNKGDCTKERFDEGVKAQKTYMPTKVPKRCQVAVFKKCCKKCVSAACFEACALEGGSSIVNACS